MARPNYYKVSTGVIHMRQYSEKSFHKSTGLDRDYYDKWKSQPIYRNGNKFSKSKGSDAFRGLRALAQDNIANFKRRNRNLGTVESQHISSDSEDISMTFYFDEEEDYDYARSQITKNPKNLNTLPAFNLDGYSLENVHFSKVGTFKVDLEYCFDYDLLDESLALGSIRKPALFERADSMRMPYILNEDGTVKSMNAVRDDLIYEAQNGDLIAIEDFKNFGGNTEDWTISLEGTIAYIKDLVDYSKTGAAIGFEYFDSIEELTKSLIEDTLHRLLPLKQLSVSVSRARVSSGKPTESSARVSLTLDLGGNFAYGYTDVGEMEEDVEDSLNSVQDGIFLSNLTKTKRGNSYTFNATLDIDYSFVQDEGNF